MMDEEEVRREGTYRILMSRRAFSDGFNVYEDQGDGAVKINPRLSWFTTLKDAQRWLEKYKERNR